MPVKREYMEGMISPPIVTEDLIGVRNAQINEQGYRDAQKMIGLSRAEQADLDEVGQSPYKNPITTPAEPEPEPEE